MNPGTFCIVQKWPTASLCLLSTLTGVATKKMQRCMVNHMRGLNDGAVAARVIEYGDDIGTMENFFRSIDNARKFAERIAKASYRDKYKKIGPDKWFCKSKIRTLRLEMINLDGIYLVIGRSGILLWFIGDKKHIKGNTGFNYWFGIKWGKFDITYEDGKIIFTYRKGGIVDKLKAVDENKLTGKFYQNDKFIGNFEMVRIK